jgi:hypothetical protein
LLTWRIEVSDMPSKVTATAFVLGVIAATMAAWVLFDHSVGKATALLLGMLFGGSMYFGMKAQD